MTVSRCQVKGSFTISVYRQKRVSSFVKLFQYRKIADFCRFQYTVAGLLKQSSIEYVNTRAQAEESIVRAANRIPDSDLTPLQQACVIFITSTGHVRDIFFFYKIPLLSPLNRLTHRSLRIKKRNTISQDISIHENRQLSFILLICFQ